MSITTIEPPVARRDGRMVSRVEITYPIERVRHGVRDVVGTDRHLTYEMYCELCGELLTGLEHAEAMTEFDEHVCAEAEQ